LLLSFGTDGLVTRIEWFDSDRDAEALARFDELTALLPTPRTARRVEPNAATAFVRARTAAFAARDLDAVAALLADESEPADHQTGATVVRPARSAGARLLFAIPDSQSTHEPIATLGDSLALGRESYRATGDALGVDAGELEGTRLTILEAGPDGRARRGGKFGAGRPRRARVRPFERPAQLLPRRGGPERPPTAPPPAPAP